MKIINTKTVRASVSDHVLLLDDDRQTKLAAIFDSLMPGGIVLRGPYPVDDPSQSGARLYDAVYAVVTDLTSPATDPDGWIEL